MLVTTLPRQQQAALDEPVSHRVCECARLARWALRRLAQMWIPRATPPSVEILHVHTNQSVRYLPRARGVAGDGA